MKLLKDLIEQDVFEKAKEKKFPGFVKPMLATLTDDYFNDSEWIYERKLDGERCEILIENAKVFIYSRNEKKLNSTYPELVEALEKEKYPNLILDGEIVTFDGDLTSFSKLQNRMQLKNSEDARKSDVKVYLYVFDIMYYQDYAIDQFSLKARKKILKAALTWDDPVRFVAHRNEDGKAFHKEACQKGWEGIIAKDGESTYVHSRSKKWLKFKCAKGQELVIGGFTEPEGERLGFGALLVGYYEKNALMFAGKVGTGFDDEFLKKWREKFNQIEQDFSPFENFDNDENGANHWIKPKYVGEFGFTEWTDDNKLRHPRFLGIRDDKEAEQVTKEVPE
ncbi:MAG: non-homologous end-joining DNA ligase [Psychroflexus sp.]